MDMFTNFPILSAALALSLAGALTAFFPQSKKAAPWFVFLSFIVIIFHIVFEWKALGRPPFKTFFETYILLCACVSLLSAVSAHTTKQTYFALCGSVACSGVLLWAFLNPDLQTALLPPALQSVYFVPHVTVYFLGYALLMLAFCSALKTFFTPDFSTWSLRTDRIVLTAFVFLAFGLSLGALWADEAWGTYWGWDPKESWALVTWLFLGAYIHLRKPLRQSKSGMGFVVLPLLAVAFTYLGMHLLPTADLSIHIYTEG